MGVFLRSQNAYSKNESTGNQLFFIELKFGDYVYRLNLCKESLKYGQNQLFFVTFAGEKYFSLTKFLSNMKLIFTSLLIFGLSVIGFAQGSISGKILEAGTGEGLIGASIQLDGPKTTGTVTDYDGSFSFSNLPKGEYKLTASYIGFTTIEKNVSVTSGNIDLGTITMEEDQYSLSEVQVVADYVVERRTPVAVATLNKEKIEATLGSRDIPMMMNMTPSVYATEQGGGSGDSRINVRGFDQRNVAIMVNGVPVNDMENGWVYWSNWDGIGDATESVQLQRGLSAVNLATPSIGGTMNIVTSPANKKAGGSAKFEVGSGGFLKATLSGNSGLINNKFAVSASAVRKVGKGIVDKTWTDAWAYYLGTSFVINKNHKLELFGMGAPQRHGQNLYKQNIAAYGHEFARSFEDYDVAAFNKFPEANDSLASSPRFYNENWNYVSESYDGKQFWNGKEHDRYDKKFINERENFYNKPLVNLNWYAKFTPKMSLYTTAYWSGGKGGGSGTMGKMKYNYHVGYPSPSRIVDWDATIASNKANGAAKGILRNSRNNQNTIGAISKLKMKWNDNVKSTFGIDWRTAKIDHFREVRDLLGGTHWVKTSDEFHPNQNVGLGDRVAYNFTNTVDWLGGFAQTEYNADQFSIFGMIGVSTIKYSYLNHFKKDSNGEEKSVVTDPIKGLQVKGGGNYRISDQVNVFANVGYVSKVPIFDAVIDDGSGEKAKNPQNEKFYAGEAGVNFFTPDNKIQARLSGYYTSWLDRTKSFPINEQDGSTDRVYVTGMNQLHTGIELDINYKPVDMLELALTTSLATWKNTNDVSGSYRTFDSVYIDKTYNFYVKDLLVGDAPQNQYVLSATVFPVEGLSAQVLWSYYSKFYAQWDPFSRTDEADRAQSWKMPNYSLLDMHLSYKVKLGSTKLKIFAHGFNLLDKMYVSDARDNSKYNAYRDSNKKIVNPHKADAAEVYLGSPRKFTLGVKVDF